MSSEEPATAYQTYLLRLCQRTTASTQGANDQGIINDQESAMEWQFTLVHPYTGARRAFNSLEALMAFLQEQIDR